MDFTRLWVDKHRPTSLEQLDFNDELTKTLTQLGECDDLPHLIFYGKGGIGKKTRVMCLLNEIYGKGVFKFTKDSWKRKINSTEVEVPLLNSKFHIDMTPSDAGNHDKTVIQTLIKETASSVQLNSKSQKGFMTIIFNEAEKLSKEAQASLRRTMEKYVSKCRLILICENLGNLIPALLSRCLLIRVRSPTPEEIKRCLVKVAELEGFKTDAKELSRIIEDSSLNLRRAILGLQNLAIRSKSTSALKIQDWKDSVKHIVKEVLKSQTPATLKQVRCYDLLVNCIPAGMIIREMLDQFMSNFKSDYVPKLVKYAAYYENQLHHGSKDLVFIEAFLAQVMVLIAEQRANIKPTAAELMSYI